MYQIIFGRISDKVYSLTNKMIIMYVTCTNNSNFTYLCSYGKKI